MSATQTTTAAPVWVGDGSDGLGSRVLRLLAGSDTVRAGR